jgi:hypothetical protein
VGHAAAVHLRVNSEARPPAQSETSVDREHLDSDARQIPRMARRYATHLGASAHNGISDVERVVYQCAETLTRDVMKTHDVTREQMRVR